MKRLVLIDGKSVFYRGYYAMGALSLSDGTPTGGVYGFAAIAMEIVKKLNPTKVVVAWDSKTSVSKRRELYPEYKAGRVKPGDDFYTQIPLLETLIRDLGWSFIEVDNYDEKELLLDSLFEKSRVQNSELFALDVDLVIQLLSSFDGTQIYPQNESKEQTFSTATTNRLDKENRALIPDGIYYLEEQQKDFELIKRQYKHVADIMTYDDLAQRLRNIIASLEKRI